MEAPILRRRDPGLARVRIVTTRSGPPVPLTPLVGRAGELRDLGQLVLAERVLTLTGAGGCGKTRLAYELATRLTGAFPDGVAWVDLAACSSRSDVLAAAVDALGGAASPGDADVDGVARLVRRRPHSLLVLDNAEHVVAIGAELVSAVAEIPEVTVVCTSREPIGVAGEIVWRVPSLSAPGVEQAGRLSLEALARFDAVTLFVDRARRSRRGFALTEANAVAVTQICARLDGLPLAIELAAARVRNLPPERIAAQLDDRFRLLAGGPRTLLPRQQTLLASVAWSEDLLSETERIVFRRLGVFVGGFTTEAATQVVSRFGDVDPYDVAEAVSQLVDKSLVQLDDERDRYVLLDTIRSYATQRLLATDELARAREFHAEWFATWLAPEHDDEAGGLNEWWRYRLATIDRVDPEWPNCASALDWARVGSPLALRLVAGLGDYWALRQRDLESARYGMPSLREADREQPEWLTAVLRMQAVRTNSGDAEFFALRAAAADLARARGDRRSELRLEFAGHIAGVMLFGPTPELLGALEAARREAIEIGEWYTAWNSTQSPAVILVTAGRYLESDALVGEMEGCRALLIRALGAQDRGEFGAAAALAEQAGQLLDARLGAAMDRVLTVFCAAGLALAHGDPAPLDALPDTDANIETLPSGFMSAYCMARGVEALLDNRVDDAVRAFADLQPDLFTTWRLVGLLAQAQAAAGQLDDATATARRILAVTDAVDAPQYRATAELVLAEATAATDTAAALDHAHRALTLAADAGLWPAAIDALEGVAVLWAADGRPRDAARLLGAAEHARSQFGYRYRFAHRASAWSDARAALIDDPGWTDGAGLALTDAVAIAQRGRGERGRPSTGWGSLTPTEWQVVSCVADGLTNPKIAERLLMSRATVKTHLVHVYAKLGMGNRAELAAAATRRIDREAAS